MNRLENLIMTIVLMFILIIIFAGLYPILGDLFDPVVDSVNTTGYGNYTTISGHINGYQAILGFWCLCFGVAIIVQYFLNAHREEFEEYEVYQNYKYR